jgi:hypothetical protein
VEENDVPLVAGFDKLTSVPEERITDKIQRRVVSGKQAQCLLENKGRRARRRSQASA